MSKIISETCQIPDLYSIYEKYIVNHHTKVFVEVGAYDGETFSNTSGLADNGWSGYYIEPIKEYYEKCKKRHEKNNVVVSNLAISDFNGILNISKAGDISTASKDAIDFFNNGAIPFFHNKHKNDFVECKCITLNDYLLDNKVSRNFALLVIDCEGFEFNVIKDFNFDYYYPRMIIIELHEDSPEWLSNEAIMQDTINCLNILKMNGYKKIYRDAINSIFIREYEL